MTDVLATTEDGIAKGAALLQAGELVAFPTDTVYGVGVAASRPDRLASIFDLKNRPLDKRIPILVSDLSQVDRYEVDDRARALAARFWPGALTLILRGADESQAFRAPDHPVALALIRAAGPLLVTSANRSNEPDTLGADEVLIAFARQQDELAAVLDGGSVPGGVASTVVDLSVTPARLLREGPISRAELAEVVELAR
jgi:tRNA threonylcarbamoyl adenosine modification protein (Sua5/YciO/YrdC/YwlC family)